MRRVALSLVLALPALGAPAGPNESVKQTVEAYLGTIDTPVTDARWKALGPDAGPVLASIAAEDPLPTRRAKALHALAVVDPARAAPLARADAANVHEPLVVRSAAVAAVAMTLPAAEAVQVLRPVLAQANVPLQRRCAEVLASVGPAGCAAVQAHTAHLNDEARAPYATALAHCSAAAAR